LQFEVVMERVVYAVSPCKDWRIECGSCEPTLVDDMYVAIIRAHDLAREEYDRRGIPTAVAISYGSGDAVMTGYHG